jgi:hypothetical protein
MREGHSPKFYQVLFEEEEEEEECLICSTFPRVRDLFDNDEFFSFSLIVVISSISADAR